MEHFVGSYKVNKIISTNMIELELLELVKTHLVVNVSRVQMYKDQIEGQERKWSCNNWPHCFQVFYTWTASLIDISLVVQ